MFCRPQAVHARWLLVFSLALPPWAGGQQIFRSSRANQAVRGHLLGLEAGTPILTGAITLISGSERLGTTITDEDGYFFLPIAEPGEYQLEARRLGYATTVSQPIQVAPGDTLTVRFGVLPRAVLLEPLLVVGRTRRGVNQFSDHMEEWGEGIFLTPEMIDSTAPRHYGDVFRKQEDTWLSWGWGTLTTGSKGLVPRVRSHRGKGCMTYMVNRIPIVAGTRFGSGNWYLLEGMDPEKIVAVEIYRYPGEVPPDLSNFGDWATSSLRASGTSQLGRYRGGSWADPVGGATYSNREFGECGVVVYWTTEEW